MYKDLIILLDESTSIKVNDNVTSSPFHDIASGAGETAFRSDSRFYLCVHFSGKDIYSQNLKDRDKVRDANFNCKRLPISLAVDYEDAESWQGSSSAVDA